MLTTIVRRGAQDRADPAPHRRASAHAARPILAPRLRPAKSSAATWTPPQSREIPAWSAAS
jgi:hypothetical protein